MNITATQVEQILGDIRSKGVTSEDLAESLLDHICCFIENSESQSFSEAYDQALKSFGAMGLQRVQAETKYMLNLKVFLRMKKSIFILAYLAAILSSTGLLFKIMHWPGANVMLVLGIAVLNFGFLPLYFKDKYRKAVS